MIRRRDGGGGKEMGRRRDGEDGRSALMSCNCHLFPFPIPSVYYSSSSVISWNLKQSNRKPLVTLLWEWWVDGHFHGLNPLVWDRWEPGWVLYGLTDHVRPAIFSLDYRNWWENLFLWIEDINLRVNMGQSGCFISWIERVCLLFAFVSAVEKDSRWANHLLLVS